MIIKYLKEGVWGFIDNIRQVASEDIEPLELVKRYDNRILECPIKEGEDPVAYCDGKRLPEEIIASNKAFMAATVNLEVSGTKSHFENLLSPERIMENYPAKIILLYVEDNKDYDSIVLVTNETVYLMNDKGHTIERLV